MSRVLETARMEDYVEYFIFPDNRTPEWLEYLAKLRKRILHFLSPHLKSYIWHKDEFVLRDRHTAIKDENGVEILPPHLYGILHFGENIEDEWFTVSLLVEISKRMPSVIIRVIDADGEFLLIEAGNRLEKWMNPEICDKKVYITNGKIHVLPANEGVTSVSKAVSSLRIGKYATSLNENITEEVFKRIKDYPNKIDKMLHRGRARIPAKVAAVLDKDPKIISLVTMSFVQRDMIDMRACRQMNKNFPPQDLVARNVTFTKFLYAMISQQKFVPEIRSGWHLPPPTHPTYKEEVLGAKITCGLEILASQFKKIEDGDLILDKNWNRYLSSLKEKGYFRDMPLGSKQYIELEAQAMDYYSKNINIPEPDSGNRVRSLMENLKFNLEEYKRQECNLPPSDDEKWLDVTEEEFGDILKQRFGSDKALKDSDVLSSVLNKFLHSVSDLEGVEYGRNENSAQLENPKQKDAVFFDPDEFEKSLMKILDFSEIEDSDKEMSSADDDTVDSEEDETPMKKYFRLMDEELERTTMAKSFIKAHSGEQKGKIDLKANALLNLKESLEEQRGNPGPASVLIDTAGIKLNTDHK